MTNDYSFPEIPAYITIHMGKVNSEADNVTVSFPDYIKSVSSSQLDPNIPTDALYAIIYAQITLALNRILSRFYRTRGYNFDITNDPDVDQLYVYMHPTYDNVNRIVDNIFNEYISRENENMPISAEICYDSIRCRGLSVESSIEMAENGMSYEEILKYAYGRNIYIVKDAIVSGLPNELMLTYPIYPMEKNSSVSSLQLALNRVGANYVTIPKIENVNGLYDDATVNAVIEFQKIFDLNPTGYFEKDTYYKLLYIYNSVKQLNILVEMGVELSEILPELRADLSYGSVGNIVKLLQYYLYFVSVFDNRVLPPQIIGVFGEKTYQSVVSFQRIFGFEPNGIVDSGVWNYLLDVYESLYSTLPPSAFSESAASYFGNILVLGSVGAEVRYLQGYLNEVGKFYDEIPNLTVNGVYDEQTENAVKAFQRLFGIKETGVTTSTTWDILSGVYNAIKSTDIDGNVLLE